MRDRMFPEIKSDSESFESYLERWPKTLSHIPDCVIENWIHRHWREFEDWKPLSPDKWNYELCSFNNEEILEISHVSDWPAQFLAWGDQLIKEPQRKETWLGSFMLEKGTTPAPIIVAKNFGDIVHPVEFGNQLMKEPLQLIEGHMRLSYLKGIIINKSKNLNDFHKVWVVTK